LERVQTQPLREALASFVRSRHLGLEVFLGGE
jgi:hypothetical protein